MNTKQQKSVYLRAMGIQSWSMRGAPQNHISTRSRDIISTAAETLDGHESVPPIVSDASPIGNEVRLYSWDELQQVVQQCVACDLHRTRKNTVFGVGFQQAEWMIVGEAPGADEDRQGEPFVGRAGQLLNNMLLAIGLKREQVYIANILKCRPPNNRDPRPEEVLKCEPFLRRQVELLAPKIILAVGRIAAHNLLKTDNSLAKLRGKCFYYGESKTPLVVTYHPAYLLRSPMEKRKAWQDLQFAQQVSQGII